jgi:hypothetical protein
MKLLFTLTAFVELGAGLALLGSPALAVDFLLGSTLTSPAAISVARVGGAGLLALGIACWFARRDGQSHAAKGLVAAMSIYNVGAVVILTLSNAKFGMHGMLLWPAVILHVGMAIWCITCLQYNSLIVM